MSGEEYPILLTYQDNVNILNYSNRIKTMLDELEQEYKFNAQDAMLVFKDILYNVWKKRSGSRSAVLSIELSPLRRRRI